MQLSSSPICKMATCVKAVYVSEGSEGESFPVRQAPCTADNQPHSVERDFFFVERPSQDFFCPVSLELLLEPQLTSCCGHHLSLEAAPGCRERGSHARCVIANGGAPCWISTTAAKSTKCAYVVGIKITGVNGREK